MKKYFNFYLLTLLLTLFSSAKAWAYDDWTSTNCDDDSEDSYTWTIYVPAGRSIVFDWSVSSESNWDWLTVTIDGKQVIKKSGEDSGTDGYYCSTAKTVTMVATYSKDGVGSNGSDCGMVTNIRIDLVIPQSISLYNFTVGVGVNSSLVPNITPSYASIKSMIWKSSNPKVATVSQNGTVSGVSCGTATITATATDGSNLSASCTVTVPNNMDEAYLASLTEKVDTIVLSREGILGSEALKLHDNLSDFKNLVVSGPFDEYDWKSIREMTNLRYLDISGVVADAYPTESTNTSVKYVIMSDWIDEINGNPFESANLRYLYIPKNVTKLTGNIHRASSIMQLEGCEGVTTIGSYAFGDGSSTSAGVLGYLSFPALTSLGSGAFYGTQYLKGFEAPLLESVPNKAFQMSKIAEVDLPKVKSVGEYAFANGAKSSYSSNNYFSSSSCYYLTTANLPSIETIGNYAFAGQSHLTSIDISTAQTLGNMAFYNANLTELNIPNITSIGSKAFYNCNTLKTIEAPRVTTISDNAFYGCSKLETANLSKLESVGDSAFANCTSLTAINLPKITSVGQKAFKGCTSATEVNLSDKLTAIGDNAFYGCTNVGTVTLPASIVKLNTNCFSGSNNIKTINCNAPAPPAVGDTPFTMQTIYTATLFVPSASIGLYQTDKYWKHFSKFEVNPTVLTDLVLASHSVLGDVRMDKINLTINAGASMSMSGSDAQDFRSVLFKANGTNAGMFLSNCERITSDETKIEYSLSGLTWYFLCLPYNVTISTVENSESARLAIYSYDGSKRASSGTGYAWTRMADNATLTAGVGYIIQASKATTLTFPAPTTGKDKPFLPYDVTKTLAANTSSTAANQGWNFIGNPYLTYYDIAQLEYDAPITVWTGSTYAAYTPSDDEYALKPLQPFFVQAPSGTTSLKFKADGRQTTSTITHASEAKSRVASSADRQVVDITISADSTMNDRTRFVINSKMTDDYDLTRDAAKMMSMDESIAQIYTINRGISYAINEGPQAEGFVKVGFLAPKDGTYTISAVRGNAVMLYDADTDETVNISDAPYTFETSAGTNESRFRIIISDEATAINGIATATQNEGTEVFDASGRKLAGTVKGINIIRQNGNASKVIK